MGTGNVKIIVFYHALLGMGEPLELVPHAAAIVHGQMEALKSSGLEDAASEIHVGVNGGEAVRGFAESLFPDKAKITYHNDQCRNENRTILMLEERIKTLADADCVLYFHSKGASHDPESDYGKFAGRWRRCMMGACVERWRECVAVLGSGVDACGAHWMTGLGHDRSQHYFGGTYFYATGKYLKTVPSIMERERIKTSGIDSVESRYEAEVWIGNSKRLPKIKDMDMSHSFAQCP